MVMITLKHDVWYGSGSSSIVLRDNFDYYVLQEFNGPKGRLYMCFCDRFPFPVLIERQYVKEVIQFNVEPVPFSNWLK